MNKNTHLKATSDMFIKYLFGLNDEESNRLLLSFINAVQEVSGQPSIKEIKHKNPFNYRKFKSDKLSILDIVVTNENNQIYNIEVQNRGNDFFPNRSLYYWAKLYSDQLKNREKYKKLNPTITINILDFTLFPDIRNFHNYFVITNATDNSPSNILTDHFMMHFLELPKIVNLKTSSKIEQWLLYLKKEGQENEMLNFLIKEERDFEIAHKRYKRFINNEKYMRLALAREKAERDRIYHLDIAKEQGIEQEKIIIVQKMKEKGFSSSEISEITGLSPQKIDKL